MSSIQKRPNGKWRARYRDSAGKEHARHFERKVEAQRWLDSVTASVVRGDYVDPQAGRITVLAFYEDWRERQVWAPGTRRAMDLAVTSAPFKGQTLARVRKSHVEMWIKHMSTPTAQRGKALATGTIHTRVQNLRSVLRAAVDDRVIARDPSAGVRLPRQRRADSAMRIPTTEEVGRVLDAADGPFKAFVAVCGFAGLRLGEAAALQVSDVAFLKRTLTVARQVQRGERGAADIRPPKYGSERTVFLPAELVEMLAAHVDTYVPDGTGWLFRGEGMQPPHQNTVGHRWRSTLKEARVEGLRLHDLRHFFASGLIAAGCDVVTVQRALGHSRATTTLNTYSHLWPSAEDGTRAAAGDLLAEALSHSRADSLRTAGTT